MAFNFVIKKQLLDLFLGINEKPSFSCTIILIKRKHKSVDVTKKANMILHAKLGSPI